MRRWSGLPRQRSPSSLARIDAEAGPEGVVIRVTDQGPGIPPHELSRIFDRFYKGPTSKGSGLGLTIARSLMIAHGGTIEASSGPTGGTSITITLPLPP